MKNFRPSIHLPINLAMIVILLAKLAGDKLRVCRLSNSVFSPSTVYSLSCSRTFDCSKAKTLLGYSPIVSFQVIAYIVAILNIDVVIYFHWHSSLMYIEISYQ